MALAYLVLLAAPAGAHAAEGEDASNLQTRLHSISPQVPGLDVKVIENGNRMEVTNRTGEEVVVLGYQDEPYLRIGPDGVAENLRSPATYLNQDRQGTSPVPGSADPDAEPEWSQISDGNVARWHDHRIHWMGGGDPPAVRDETGQYTVIPEWVVPMRIGGTTVEVTGDLVWVPGPGTLLWLAIIAVVFALTVAGALTRAWRPVLAVGVAILVLADVAHALGVGFAGVGSLASQLGQVVSGSFVSIVGWVIGTAAAVLLARRHQVVVLGQPAGLLAAALAGVLIGFNGGLADLGDIGRSQILFAWPTNLFRATTALALGVGLGILAGAAARVLRPSRET